MSYEMDPEVLADLKLRAATEYDRTRSRPSRDSIGTWQPDPIVAGWRCRNDKCPEVVPVTQETIDRAEIFDRELVRRGEMPIDRKATVFCEACVRRFAASRGVVKRNAVDELAQVIAKIKASPNPRNEHTLLEQLRKRHHPDIDGLLQSLEGPQDGVTRRAKGKL